MGYNIDKMKYGWWKSEIKNIRDKIKSTESLQEKIHNERLLGFLKTNLFESAIYQAESLMNYETAIEFFELWSLTDPENPYPFLYIARNYMRLEKLKKAKKYLNLSKEKGIEKYFELESDPLIEAILSF